MNSSSVSKSSSSKNLEILTVACIALTAILGLKYAILTQTLKLSDIPDIFNINTNHLTEYGLSLALTVLCLAGIISIFTNISILLKPEITAAIAILSASILILSGLQNEFLAGVIVIDIITTTTFIYKTQAHSKLFIKWAPQYTITPYMYLLLITTSLIPAIRIYQQFSLNPQAIITNYTKPILQKMLNSQNDPNPTKTSSQTGNKLRDFNKSISELDIDVASLLQTSTEQTQNIILEEIQQEITKLLGPILPAIPAVIAISTFILLQQILSLMSFTYIFATSTLSWVLIKFKFAKLETKNVAVEVFTLNR